MRSRFRFTFLAASLLATFAVLAGGAWWFATQTRPADAIASLVFSSNQRGVCPLPAPQAGAPAPELVWVPEGSMDYGDTVYPEEGPVRPMTVSGFWMDRTEVTNDQFAAFVAATGYRTVAERGVEGSARPDLPPELRAPGAMVFAQEPVAGGQRADFRWRYQAGANWRQPMGPGSSIAGRGAYPVVAVTYEDAMAYAAWKGRTLPTELQWEWAARAGASGGPPQANTWQGLFPVVDTAEDGFAGLAPVGCFGPDRLGLHDMLGNAWELTADVYTDSHDAPVPPPRRDALRRVIKGGSFLCSPNACRRYRAGARQPQEEDLATLHVGFRTVLAP